MLKGANAIEQSGIVPEHATIILDISRCHKTVIMFRPVNRLSTGLIKEGYATKDLHVKGKSSDWGPQAGFICCDQKYSKLASKPLATIENFNKKVKSSIDERQAVAVPLLISDLRIRYLVSHGLLTIRSKTGDGYVVYSQHHPFTEFKLIRTALVFFSPEYADFKMKHRIALQMMYSLMDALRSGYCVMVKEKDALTELMVLANPENFAPFTADYDMFAVIPHLSKFESPAKRSFKAAVKRVQESLAQRERRNFHCDLGRISMVARQIMQEINFRVGNKVVHHGCEVDNPVTELDFPIIAFTPWGEVIAASNQQQLEAIVRDLLRLGFAFYANRLWSQTGQITSNAETGPTVDYGFDTGIETETLTILEVLSSTATLSLQR